MTQPLPGQRPLPGFPDLDSTGYPISLEADLSNLQMRSRAETPMADIEQALEQEDAAGVPDPLDFFSEDGLLRRAEVPDRGPDYDRIVADAKALFTLRNQEYGDSIVRGGVLGAVYELIGVSERLKQVILFNRGMSDDRILEVIGDKALDGINYSVIILMLLEQGNLFGR